ncbi:lycopene cyclase family protein [Gramella jeungdoensis]|uniref:Lycopene cyclase family protein n=1 Tax=Gramella jeungdoensis TaxID=708091 RepID=A0ABT0YX67_9FLAO|nr:lycopene cyclase family protein [Gramella jeungdoensis]MCM8568046.1 lycopene cyclase family protein [Gramella jeungdoensis]
MLVPDYYYVIVGGGLAGLQLASRINNDVFFKGKKIAIIEPSKKIENDKTWCFWQNTPGKWDHLIHKSWNKAAFFSSETEQTLDLGEYSYNMIRSSDFYEDVKKELEKSEDFIFIQDRIEKIDPVTRTAVGKKANYTATHFFDSRLTDKYKEEVKHTVLYQHFKGWLIETQENIFDPGKFTMMDFRLKYKDSTSFTYVLPLTAKKALIEFTFFTPFLTAEKVYDEMLERYLKEILQLKDWKITETETGIIPMTDFPFHENNSAYITRIGTAGGWVKPSSGYSFKSTERKVEQIIENIKSGLATSEGLFNKSFARYDSIFLDVLSRRNDLGESLFTKFYTKNSIEDIFRFLDEETSFSENIKIMLSLYHPEFIKSFFRKL